MMPADLFDALDAFGRSVVEAVPGAEYAGISVRTGARPEPHDRVFFGAHLAP